MPDYRSLRKKHLNFPWRDGNSIDLLIDAEQFYPKMISAIDQASDSIYLEMYLFESGIVATEFINALGKASKRGVNVYLLLDDFGSKKLVEADRQRITGSAINLRFYNPLRLDKFVKNISRDHRKILIVDNEKVFVGGAGITDEFEPPLEPKRKWRENMILVHGPVVGDWVYLFKQAWGEAGSIPGPAASGAGNSRYEDNVHARVMVGRGRWIRNIYRSLLKRVNRSKKTLWICTAYFQPSRNLRRALRRAATRNVDVRLLLPGPETDHPRVRIAGRRFYTRLLKAGVRIFEYQDRVLHSKTVLCDHWVSIGSSNFDNWNLRWNLEANQEIEHTEFAHRTRRMFEHDFQHSREISCEAWLDRPRSDRLAEWFWGWVEFWVTRIGGKGWND